jgi:hypothetical protein
MQSDPRILVNLLVILVKILVNLLVIVVNIPVKLTRMNPMGAMGGLPLGEYTRERLVRL